MKHCYVILLSIALFWSMDHCRWHCCAAMLEYWSCLCQPAPCCSWMTQQGVPNFTQRTTHAQGAEVLTWPFNLWNHVEYLYAPICGSVSGVLVQPLEWPEIIPRQWLWGFKSCWSCGLWESAPGPFIARKKGTTGRVAVAFLFTDSGGPGIPGWLPRLGALSTSWLPFEQKKKWHSIVGSCNV